MPSSRHRLHERCRIILCDQAHRRADHQGHGEQRDSDDVRDRQHAILHVVRRHAAQRGGVPGAEQQIAVGQHDALRRPGRARGVDENRDLPGAVGFDRLGRRRLVQRRNADAVKRSDILHGRTIARRMGGRFLRYFGREEGAAGAAVIPDLIDLARRQPRIDDDRPGVEPARGEQQTGQRNGILADDHHAVAGRGCRARAARPRVPRTTRSSSRYVNFALSSISAIRSGVARDVPVHHLVDAVRQTV